MTYLVIGRARDGTFKLFVGDDFSTSVVTAGEGEGLAASPATEAEGSGSALTEAAPERSGGAIAAEGASRPSLSLDTPPPVVWLSLPSTFPPVVLACTVTASLEEGGALTSLAGLATEISSTDFTLFAVSFLVVLAPLAP